MRWLKSDIWKAGIAIAGLLLLLLVMIWIPVSAAGAHEGALGPAGPAAVIVQVTTTANSTIAKECQVKEAVAVGA